MACTEELGLQSESRQIEIGADGKARDEDVAAEEQVALLPLQMERGVGKRADALGVTNVHLFARHRQVGIDAMLISKRTAHGQQAAAAHRGQVFHFQPVLVELESAVQLAQAVGQIFERERAVLEIDAPLQLGVQQGPVRLHLEGRQSAGGQIGVESFCQLQVDGAVGGKIELLGALKRQIALHMQIGIFAGDVQRIEMDALVGQRGVQCRRPRAERRKW